MMQTPLRKITESELVLELEKAKIVGVNKRAVARWRNEGLLPDFDINGRGLGKGLGKTESLWERPDIVIEQAKWIQRMRSVGIKNEDLHLNMWMLDYDIHPEDVRDSLLEPLVGRIELLEAEASELGQKCDRTNNIIEDVINDGVLNSLLDMFDSPLALMAMPPEVIEAVMNIFFNPEYNLNDFSFADSFEALEEWESKAQKFESELIKGEGLELKKSNNHTQIIFNFLENADFIQQHFSIHQIERAVKECSHEVLAEVQKDIQIIAKIIMIFGSAVPKIIPHIQLPLDDTFSTDQFLPFLFNLGELVVLADISLRYNGYSEKINWARWQVLNKIEEEFSETVRKEIEQSAPAVGQALTKTFEIVERNLTQLAENSSEVKSAIDC